MSAEDLPIHPEDIDGRVEGFNAEGKLAKVMAQLALENEVA